MKNLKSTSLGSDYRTSLPLRGRRPVTPSSRDVWIAAMLWMGRNPTVITCTRTEDAKELYKKLRASFARGEIMPTRREP